MHPRPIRDLCDQALLASLRQHIAKPLLLGGLFRADEDPGVPPCEHVPLPAGQAVDLASEMSVDVLHEVGELLSIAGPHESVIVVGQDGDEVDLHPAELLSLCKDAIDDLIELLARPEEIPSLQGSASDLDQRTPFGYVAQSSSHTPIKTEKAPPI